MRAAMHFTDIAWCHRSALPCRGCLLVAKGAGDVEPPAKHARTARGSSVSRVMHPGGPAFRGRRESVTDQRDKLTNQRVPRSTHAFRKNSSSQCLARAELERLP